MRADYRSAPLYRTADGAPYDYSGPYQGIGPLPAELTQQPRPSAAHIWDGAAWQLDEALRASLHRADALVERCVRMKQARRAIEPCRLPRSWVRRPRRRPRGSSPGGAIWLR